MTESELEELADRLRLYLLVNGGLDFPYVTANLGTYRITSDHIGTMIYNAAHRVFFYHRVRVPVIECTSDYMAMDILRQLRTLQILDTLARIRSD